MCLLCIRANKPYINNKVAYLTKWCSCLALLAGMHILTATLLTVLSWPQIPSVFLHNLHSIIGTKGNRHCYVMYLAFGALDLPYNIPTAQTQGQRS